MAEVLLFHHAQGLTSGVLAFADGLRRAGHPVHTPDLFDGRTFDTAEEGVGYAEEVGFGEMIERGRRAAEELPAELVYAGFRSACCRPRAWRRRQPSVVRRGRDCAPDPACA